MECESSFTKNGNVSNSKKRAFNPDAENLHSGPRSKRGKAKSYPKDVAQQTVWPQHFHDLFKIYKALNTVLAFVSSKKNVATTYGSIKSSVENLLQRPLEMGSVAEIKALLPDLIVFAYTESNCIQSEETSKGNAANREHSPNFLIAQNFASTESRVLTIDFKDRQKGKSTRNTGRFQYQKFSKESDAPLQNVLRRRNDMFRDAINKLLHKSESPEQAIEYLRSVACQHMPTNHTASSSSTIISQEIPNPENRFSMDDIISQIQYEHFYRQQLVYRKTIEAKEAKFATLDPPLSPLISQTLASCRNISLLYSHQVAAIRAIAEDKNVIVSTSTASGKSLIYQVPILKCLEENTDLTAMLIYPTKALAQDQLASFQQLVTSHPLLSQTKCYTYDGDTVQEHRAVIRQTASLLFTNFDTLHMSILPHEEQWRRFLQNLKFVVVDELHYYSGLFGREVHLGGHFSPLNLSVSFSHVAQIIRRLRRLCGAVGNRRVRFVSCTATIFSPLTHMQVLTGLELSDIEVILEDGAPSGRKDFVVWNPRANNGESKAVKTSGITEAITLMIYLMTHGVRVILFCKVGMFLFALTARALMCIFKLRKVCELTMKYLITALGDEGRHDILQRVRPYRGGAPYDILRLMLKMPEILHSGYSPTERRAIERDAFSGHLLGIIATNALELGVDIGILDAVIMLGFPGTIASFRQQSGRAGRRARDSLVVLIANPYPVDQHYLEHPTDLFEQQSEDISIDIDNTEILEAHLQCAAYEMPICVTDEQYFGPKMIKICEEKLSTDSDGWYHTHPNFLPFPAEDVLIRGVIQDKYTVIRVRSGGKANCILEELEVTRAMFEIYEGGVFMHQGMAYVVKEVNHDLQLAMVIRANVNYITAPRDYTNVDAIETQRIKSLPVARVYYGRVNIYMKVFGFFKIKDNMILDAVELETPAWDHETTGFWIDISRTTLGVLKDNQIAPAAAIHSAQHALLNQFYLSRDVGTECKAPEKEYKVTESSRKRPARLIFYDIIGKGIGVSIKAFDNVHSILTKVYHAVEQCTCKDGCLSCICSESCREANEVCSKSGALAILKSLLGMEIDINALKPGSPKTAADTIIEADFVRRAAGVRIEK